ncbi:DUF4303 domain-containing protein [Pedobacter cryoconitis]|uniref:Uncharacterized protein DUF4303 n=1 Tax=Pedobacter cryoconitis TaxID=188932 RepID=A0A327SRT2_9SPHI|nr:DUF4303 domain-containing protein [Pedobacter cryoconitis]RAJ31135.1 uncharacterized protein DUF4303 [Pedobacter cryoconitis]
MQEIDFNKIQNELLAFTKTEVSKFLAAHPDEVFYAFAFDCNAEDAEVNLCFNTESAFSTLLAESQSGKYKASYQTVEQINELRYNTGDWEYQSFATTYVLSEEELFGDDEDDDHEETEDDEGAANEHTQNLLLHFSKTLVEFTKTEEYQKIHKTPDFKIFCIDHDENLDEAELRMSSFS